ncbi:MAG: ParA family protein [Pseudomonadota bacterium]
MTTIITVAQRKGGAGKTTVACQISATLIARGHSVLGVDLDEQQSFTSWAAVRRKRAGDEALFHGVTFDKFSFPSGLRRAGEAARYVVIDTPPTTEPVVKRAIKASDLVVTPLQLSPIDLEASIPTAIAVGEADREALFVINRAPPRARVADEIRRQIKLHELPCARVELGNRAAFAESMMKGMGVVEFAPKSLAAQEMNRLVDEVVQLAEPMRSVA